MRTDIAPLLHALADLFSEGEDPGVADACAVLRQAGAVWVEGPEAAPFPALLGPWDGPCHPVHNMLAPLVPHLPWYAPGASDGRIPRRINRGLRTCTLFGPDAPYKVDTLRGGLFAQDKAVPYGIRSHAAAELFVTIAGRADWTVGDALRRDVCAGGRTFHRSNVPHGSATPDSAVLAAWIWSGDISYDSYTYSGDALCRGTRASSTSARAAMQPATTKGAPGR